MTACPRPDKTPHETEGQAYAQLVWMRQAGRDVRTLTVYRCRCGKWHVGNPTSLNAKIRQAIRPVRPRGRKRQRW